MSDRLSFLTGLGSIDLESLLPISCICIAVIAVLGIAWFKLKTVRPKLSLCMVLVLSVYVAYGFSSVTQDKGRSKSAPAIQADQSELALRLGSAIQTTEHSINLPSPGGALAGPDQMNKFMSEALAGLDKGLKTDPSSAPLAARRVILIHKLGQPITSALHDLAACEKPDGPELAEDLTVAYSEKHQNDEDSDKVEKSLLKRLKPGWYQDAALTNLYRNTKQKTKLAELEQRETDQYAQLLIHFVVVVSVTLMLVLAGAIVLLVQLFTMPRTLTPPEDLSLIQAPASYGFKAVYGTFLCWLATELTISVFATVGLHGIHLAQKGVLVAALGTAFIYVLSNGPGPFYAYFLAMRPHGVGLLEGLKFRTKTDKAGLGRLILTGLCCYVAAVPLVIGSYAIAFRFFGSQGSSNPIIALVMEAARSSNISATIVFYLTVGVLAPLCEESLFRGFLYSSLRRKFGIFPSIVLSALLFAVAHMDPGGFLPLFTLGSVFAFAFEKTKSTLPGMIAHGLWNSGTFSLVLMLFGN